jgi:hypothetical protein
MTLSGFRLTQVSNSTIEAVETVRGTGSNRNGSRCLMSEVSHSQGLNNVDE